LERGRPQNGEEEGKMRRNRIKSNKKVKQAKEIPRQAVVLSSEQDIADRERIAKEVSARRSREDEKSKEQLATALTKYELQTLGGGTATPADQMAALEACRYGGDGKNALRILHEMQASGIEVAADAYNITLEALAREGQISTALKLIKEMVDNAIESDVLTYNAIITGYAQMRIVRVDTAMQVCRFRTCRNNLPFVRGLPMILFIKSCFTILIHRHKTFFDSPLTSSC
jgi:pentatricopeptide repeat protein